MKPKIFLSLVGWLLVVIAFAGFILEKTYGQLQFWLIESWGHLVFAMLVLWTAWYGSASNHKNLSALIALVALWLAITGFIVRGGEAPNYLGFHLDLADSIFYLILALFSAWMYWKNKKIP